MTKNNSFNELVIAHNNKLITNTSNIKFLRNMIDNTLSWKGHIDKIVPRLNQACYKIRAVKPFSSQDILKTNYYAYFHSVMTYGLLFWENSSHSMDVFGLQKNIIRIMMGARSRDSCREFFFNFRNITFNSLIHIYCDRVLCQ